MFCKIKYCHKINLSKTIMYKLFVYFIEIKHSIPYYNGIQKILYMLNKNFLIFIEYKKKYYIIIR